MKKAGHTRSYRALAGGSPEPSYPLPNARFLQRAKAVPKAGFRITVPAGARLLWQTGWAVDTSAPGIPPISPSTDTKGAHRFQNESHLGPLLSQRLATRIIGAGADGVKLLLSLPGRLFAKT